MLRKIIALILAMTLVLSLCACGKPAAEAEIPEGPESEPESIPETEPEPEAPVNTNPCVFAVDDAERELFSTITRIDENGALYYLDYTYDYRLDDVLEADIKNVLDLLSYADGRLITDVQQIIAAITAHCSTFTVTDGGHNYFCRNFDTKNSNIAALFIHTAPKDGYESVSLADVGSLGLSIGSADDGKTDVSLVALAPLLAVDGMNEKGLAVSAMVLDEDPACQDTGKNKIMTTVAMRLLLDRAADADEAVELLSGFDMWCPNIPRDFHFMVADAKGNCKLIEYVENEMKVMDHRYSTNFYVSPEMFGRGHGIERYEKLEKELTENNFSLSREDARALMIDVSQYGNEATESYTIWSNLYDLNDKEVSVVVERNFDTPYVYRLGTGWVND